MGSCEGRKVVYKSFHYTAEHGIRKPYLLSHVQAFNPYASYLIGDDNNWIILCVLKVTKAT